MVLVALIALSSSTYAWFAANNKVTATGMVVQAETEGGIEIAYGKSTDASGTWGTSATAGMTVATKLLPTSTANATAWYHASAEKGSESTAKVDTYETLTLSAGDTSKKIAADSSVAQDATQYYDTNGNQYYLVKNFVVRSTSSSKLAKGLKVDSVTVAGNSENMSQALRVAVKLGSKVLFYDPVANDTNAYTVYSGFTGSGTSATATSAGTVTCTDKATSTLLAAADTTEIPAKTTSTNGGVDVEVYVYFEGEDAQLYSENFKTEGLTVTINFSATI